MGRASFQAEDVMRHARLKRHYEEMIVRVRGQAVILDADLAALYGVETRV